MSSGFISGGTADQPLERDDEWRKAQQEIEERRRQKEAESRQGGEKSLYEILQNNKVAKEEAFQESIKLKNQFRNLDEDEVEFLDSVLESTRAKEQAVKEETSEQLELFRRQQQEADKERLDESEDIAKTARSPIQELAETQWAVNARKRKRLKDEKGAKGPKLRKSSSASEAPQQKPVAPKSPKAVTGNNNSNVASNAADVETAEHGLAGTKDKSSTSAMGTPKEKPAAASKSHSLQGLGLAEYSSDDGES